MSPVFSCFAALFAGFALVFVQLVRRFFDAWKALILWALIRFFSRFAFACQAFLLDKLGIFVRVFALQDDKNRLSRANSRLLPVSKPVNRQNTQSFSASVRCIRPEFSHSKSAEKNFVSKEPRKSAFLHCRFRSRSAAKTCAMLVLPSGEAPNRTERRHDEPNDVKRGDADSSGHGWLWHLPTMSTVGAICAKHSASSARLDRRSRYNLCLIPWAAINGKAYQRLFCGRGETSE